MYINKSLRILSVKEKDFMSSGSCGKVYSKSDEQIIKTYFKETVDLYKLNDGWLNNLRLTLLFPIPPDI